MHKTQKPRYHMASNILFMIREACHTCKSVLLFVVLLTLAGVGINLLELYVTPADCGHWSRQGAWLIFCGSSPLSQEGFCCWMLQDGRLYRTGGTDPVPADPAPPQKPFPVPL